VRWRGFARSGQRCSQSGRGRLHHSAQRRLARAGIAVAPHYCSEHEPTGASHGVHPNRTKPGATANNPAGPYGQKKGSSPGGGGGTPRAAAEGMAVHEAYRSPRAVTLNGYVLGSRTEHCNSETCLSNQQRKASQSSGQLRGVAKPRRTRLESLLCEPPLPSTRPIRGVLCASKTSPISPHFRVLRPRHAGLVLQNRTGSPYPHCVRACSERKRPPGGFRHSSRRERRACRAAHPEHSAQRSDDHHR